VCLVASTDLERVLDAAKEFTEGVGVPSVKMAGRPPNSPGRLAMDFHQSPPPPMMKATHHQHAKVPLVPEVVERTWFALFPLVQ
jgi:hypothetical protein